MKTLYLFAFAALLTLVVSAAGVCAYNCNTCQPAMTVTTPACPTTMSCPAPCGAGPQCWVQPTTDQYVPEACCGVAPPSCGTFCAAGQTPAGWPYNWCSEYWLRPDSNY